MLTKVRAHAVSLDRSSAPTKGYVTGTHRLVDPADTLRRVAPMLAHVGITRVANVTGLDYLGVPVTMVCRPNSRSVAVSQGKGVSLDSAKISGVMEGLELWHAEHVTLPLKLASSREMRRLGHRIVVDGLPAAVRSRYTETLSLLWVAGHDLIADATAWVPFECVSMNSTLPLPPGSGCFLSTSNGLASGNDQLEALSHALCEVVERDATTLWRLGGGPDRKDLLVDLTTVTDPSCRDVLDRCAAAGAYMLAWDITSDIGLPAFAALVTERETLRPTRATANGYGCHPDRGVALLRALTEAIQSRLTYIAGSRDDLFRREYEERLSLRESIAQLDALREHRPARRFECTPSVATDSFAGDVEQEIAGLRKAGISRVIAVDLTDADLGMPVIRVVVPGLEGPDSDPDYVPGHRARILDRRN